jgi:hypothetical protein
MTFTRESIPPFGENGEVSVYANFDLHKQSTGGMSALPYHFFRASQNLQGTR